MSVHKSGFSFEIKLFGTVEYVELRAYETKLFIFFLRKSIKNWRTAVYRFSISYLVLELQSFEDDDKIRTRNMRFLRCHI